MKNDVQSLKKKFFSQRTPIHSLYSLIKFQQGAVPLRNKNSKAQRGMSVVK